MGGPLELIAPLRCAACGRAADGDLCAGCAQIVECVTVPYCLRCGAPSSASPSSPRCSACDSLEGFERARSLLLYAGPARKLVLALKRRGRPGLASVAGRLLADLARREGIGRPDLVVWVPAGSGARQRGFDHAGLLARSVADHLDVAVRPSLRRASEGPRQADVPMARRRENVRGRFWAQPVDGRVLLVDDVFTTGATAEACALALLGAGAKAVDVATMARTVRLHGSGEAHRRGPGGRDTRVRLGSPGILTE